MISVQSQLDRLPCRHLCQIGQEILLKRLQTHPRTLIIQLMTLNIWFGVACRKISGLMLREIPCSTETLQSHLSRIDRATTKPLDLEATKPKTDFTKWIVKIKTSQLLGQPTKVNSRPRTSSTNTSNFQKITKNSREAMPPTYLL